MPASTLPEVPSLPRPSIAAPPLPAAVAQVMPLWARYVSAARILVSRCLMAGLALLLLFTESSWIQAHPLPAALLVFTGLLLTGVAAAGRLWCSLHIAGYKDRRLVTEGPYSVCRHPLYFFSLLGAMGAALASGTMIISLLIMVVFLIGYQPVMAAEEGKLRKLFGAEHDRYQARVPRLFPKWSLLRHAAAWSSNPAVFFKHATAVIWFPAAAGIVLLLPVLRSSLQLAVLFHLP